MSESVEVHRICYFRLSTLASSSFHFSPCYVLREHPLFFLNIDVLFISLLAVSD